MPASCQADLIRVFREDVGVFQQDWSDIYVVTTNKTCVSAWQVALKTAPDWDCEEVKWGHCSRFTPHSDIYREENGTVSFLSDSLVEVELSKI